MYNVVYTYTCDMRTHNYCNSTITATTLRRVISRERVIAVVYRCKLNKIIIIILLLLSGAALGIVTAARAPPFEEPRRSWQLQAAAADTMLVVFGNNKLCAYSNISICNVYTKIIIPRELVLRG